MPDVKPIKKTKEEKKLAKLAYKKKLNDNYKYGYNKSEKQNTRNLDFIGEDSAIAYIKIRGFSNGDYESFYKEAFEKIDSVKAKNLIIDLRNNGGGRLVEIHDLYSYLAQEEFKFVEEGEIKTRFPTVKSFMSRKSSVAEQFLNPYMFLPYFLETYLSHIKMTVSWYIGLNNLKLRNQKRIITRVMYMC